jgi:hypothetical protein
MKKEKEEMKITLTENSKRIKPKKLEITYKGKHFSFSLNGISFWARKLKKRYEDFPDINLYSFSFEGHYFYDIYLRGIFSNKVVNLNKKSEFTSFGVHLACNDLPTKVVSYISIKWALMTEESYRQSVHLLIDKYGIVNNDLIEITDEVIQKMELQEIGAFKQKVKDMIIM